jgi:hypothetical protein
MSNRKAPSSQTSSPNKTTRRLRKPLTNHQSPKLDRTRTHPYNRNFKVIHFFDLMNFPTGPAATRWAALFLAAPHSLEMRLE